LQSPGISITDPNKEETLTTGNQATIEGLVQIEAGQTVSVTLKNVRGYLLADSTVILREGIRWRADMFIPESYSGPAEILAMVHDGNGNLIALDRQVVNLEVDTENTEQYLSLFHPLDSVEGVAGFDLFYDGRAKLPVDNKVTISLWIDGCQTRVAHYSLTMRGSGYWYGYLTIPKNVTGLACAIAHFGSTGHDDWREAVSMVNLLPEGSEEAMGIQIGYPPSENTLLAGQTVFINGIVHYAPDNLVSISLLLENGRVLSEGNAPVGSFGFWEFPLDVPTDAHGPALIIVSIGQAGDDNYHKAETKVFIGS
jgi:hypothetical protein